MEKLIKLLNVDLYVKPELLEESFYYCKMAQEDGIFRHPSDQTFGRYVADFRNNPQVIEIADKLKITMESLHETKAK